MKHAYLIMAHHEFVVLQELIDAIDDERNDIYIHIDGKVKELPHLKASKSRLTLLGERIKTIWADVSMISVEYLLFRTAFEQGEYGFYHFISGVHYPLKSQDEIHTYFDKRSGISVLSPMGSTQDEIEMKLGFYHFFLKHLISRNRLVNKLYHILWRISLGVQQKMGMKRDVSYVRNKAANWCSLSDEAVREVLRQEKQMLRRLRHTFCQDEFLVPAVLANAGLPVAFEEKFLYAVFTPYTPKVLTENDFDDLMKSECLFARKFSARQSMRLIQRIKSTFLDGQS